MTIEEEDFRMELEEGSSRFNLDLIHIVHAKDPEKRREELKQSGYAMTLEKCIDLVIMSRLKSKKEIFSLKEFLAEYKEQTKILRESISCKMS